MRIGLNQLKYAGSQPEHQGGGREPSEWKNDHIFENAEDGLTLSPQAIRIHLQKVNRT